MESNPTDHERFAVLECVLEKQGIRAGIINFDDGPVEGYQWRLLLRYPHEGDRTEWTPWVFGSSEVVEKMLEQWNNFLATHGHAPKAIPPGKTSH